MADAFLSPAWYRVAQLRPALGAHVRVHRHRYGGEGWYVLEDRVTGRTHRVNAAAYAFVGRLDGSRTVDEIWLEVAERLDEAAPTQDEAIALLGQLHQSDLLRGGAAPDLAEIDTRRRRMRRQLWRQNLLNPLSLRIPLFDPDRLLTLLLVPLRPLVGPAGFLLWAALVGTGLLLAGRHWSELAADITDRVLARDNILLMAAVYPVVKILHELGHGLVARRYGAAVHETGVMMLIFLPVPYMDVTAASAFPSRFRRAAVGAAGIIVETGLAALALFAWLALEPGLARAICFDVMLICGVSTVLVNGNPLIRFDGYYILADLLGIPNLGPRANRWYARLAETWLFGLDDPRPFQARGIEKAVFLVYAPASFVYRIVLMATIGLFVARRYLAVGIALALWMGVQSLLLPIGRIVWHILTAPRLRRRRARAVAVSAMLATACAAALFAVPAPSWSGVEGIVWLPETAFVRAGTAGFLVTLPLAPGAAVQPGDTVAILDDPVIDARLASLSWKARELELKLAATTVTDKVLAQTTRIAFDDAVQQYLRERTRKNRMTVRAEAAGRFQAALPPGDAEGRFFKEGEIIGYILPPAADTLRVVVPQAEIEQVRAARIGIAAAPGWMAGPALAAEVRRAVPAGLYELPSAALGQAAGGPIPTDPRDARGETALARVFQFELAIPPAQAPFGARAHVKVRHVPEPLGIQLYRRARQMLLGTLDV